jgi:lysophospholipase L1-like esterase
MLSLCVLMKQKFHPYSIQLQKLFDETAGPGKIVVEQYGVSGECVSEIEQRLSRFLKKLEVEEAISKEKHVYVDWFVFLGGTNDLGSRAEPETVFESLKRLYQLARTRNARVVAVTIPDANVPSCDWLRDNRNQVNAKLRSLSGLDALVELEEHIPVSNKQMWNDHLHFSPRGYDAFGDLVFATIGNAVLASVNE